MKKNIFLPILILFANICIAQSSGSELMANDKFKHICAGATISELTYVGSNLIWKDPGVSFRMSVTINTSAAFYKEMYDSMNGGYFNFEDIGYTIISGLIVSGINYFATKSLNKRKSKKDRKNSEDPFLSLKNL